jgi:REP element-mobilizing transposase RayT
MAAMGRPLRVEFANAFYHAFSRGNERRAVFHDGRDREHFLALLGLLRERFEAEPWAYVLMPNHYHLVLRTLRPNLSRAMQWLGVAYTNWFNARHERSGHLFQGRFKAALVEDDAYLRRLLLYVHRNPLRGGLVGRLADYPWSSYRCLAYGRGCAEWFRPASALGLFGGRPREFRRAVQDYSEEADKLSENLWHGLWLGSEEGLKALVERLRLRRHEEQPQTRAALRTAGGVSVAARAAQCAAALGISPAELEDLRRSRRHVARPLRDLLIHTVWRGSEVRLSDVGAYFGVSYSSISIASRRAEAHLRADRRLAERVGRIIQN